MIQPPVFPKGTAPGLAGTLQEAARAHEEMDRRVANLDRLIRELGTAMSRYHSRVSALLAQASGRPEAKTIPGLQQEQLTLNTQYLQLLSQMQDENRSYTAISNILKTKHDTVKNSISNVR